LHMPCNPSRSSDEPAAWCLRISRSRLSSRDGSARQTPAFVSRDFDGVYARAHLRGSRRRGRHQTPRYDWNPRGLDTFLSLCAFPHLEIAPLCHALEGPSLVLTSGPGPTARAVWVTHPPCMADGPTAGGRSLCLLHRRPHALRRAAGPDGQLQRRPGRADNYEPMLSRGDCGSRYRAASSPRRSLKAASCKLGPRRSRLIELKT